MLGDRKLLIAILRDFFASTNIYKKMTDPRGRVTLMDKKKRANSIAVIQKVKMTSGQEKDHLPQIVQSTFFRSEGDFDLGPDSGLRSACRPGVRAGEKASWRR